MNSAQDAGRVRIPQRVTAAATNSEHCHSPHRNPDSPNFQFVPRRRRHEGSRRNVRSWSDPTCLRKSWGSKTTQSDVHFWPVPPSHATAWLENPAEVEVQPCPSPSSISIEPDASTTEHADVTAVDHDDSVGQGVDHARRPARRAEPDREKEHLQLLPLSTPANTRLFPGPRPVGQQWKSIRIPCGRAGADNSRGLAGKRQHSRNRARSSHRLQ